MGNAIWFPTHSMTEWPHDSLAKMARLPHHILSVSSMPHFSVVINRDERICVSNTSDDSGYVIGIQANVPNWSCLAFTMPPFFTATSFLVCRHSLHKPQTQNDGNGTRALAIASPVLNAFEFATKSLSNNLLELKATTANSRSFSWSKAFRISYQFNTKRVLLTKKWHYQNSGIQYRKRILHEKQTLTWIIPQYLTQQPKTYKVNNTLIKCLITSTDYKHIISWKKIVEYRHNTSTERSLESVSAVPCPAVVSILTCWWKTRKADDIAG